MKSLVLYSGGQDAGNADLHHRLVQLAQVKRQRRPIRKSKPLTMTYIPFCTEGSRKYFYRAIRRYAPFGVVDFVCLDPEQNPSPSDIREALKSDIVYLAGGNTFFFLHQLQRLKMLAPLREYALTGGVLAGLSAGALIMTPTIELAGLRGLDPDPNDVGLKNHRGLGLVSFEYAPHFVGSPKIIRVLKEYSRRTSHPIYASRDGGGIVIEGRSVAFVGPTWIFSQGNVVKTG